ncbi:HEAT repeat domain-containing protein [Streptomyces sp. NBC_01727]|uniref:HEAT repeat domain-containing protein n=1 Tax=Streptomyces sp. NBC_01727 TaxID=2975924 RepID=UPI002E14FF9C|nr:HEAT repeat domain-containing protein [Streptomyces sp. NBC_01727]
MGMDPDGTDLFSVKRAHELDLHYPSFGYPILICNDFDDVLSGRGSPVTPDQLIKIAQSQGRVLLQARGGSGKTETLKVLSRKAYGIGVATLLVDLMDVMVRIGAHAGVSAIAEDLLERVDSPPGSDEESLLLLDGLNEVPPEVAPAVVAAVDDLAIRNLRVSTIVTDRLSRRPLTSRWALATLGAVPEDVMREIIGVVDSKSQEMYAIPYYLDKVRPEGAEGKMRSDIHKGYLLDHAVEEKELDSLSEAAFRQYESNRSRELDRTSFISVTGKHVWEQLVGAGVIIDDHHAAAPHFTHHLIHDYLAARYLAKCPNVWGADSFDVVTFHATSFDALAMLLEQCSGKADVLLLSVYDWSMYAAAYLLAECRRGVSQVSEDLEAAILSLLAERRFDRIVATSIRVSDALRLHPSDVASRLLQAADLDAISQIVEARTFGDSLQTWKKVFTRKIQGPSEADDLNLLRSEDPLLGWTMATVIRRSRVSDARLREIGKLLNPSSSQPVRWRAAHAIGAFPSREVVEDLIATFLRDKDMWVQYGVVRSLIEAAASGGSELRHEVFSRMSQLDFLSAILEKDKLKQKVEKALLIRESPADWPESAGLLIEGLWALSETVEAQDLWRRVARDLRRA